MKDIAAVILCAGKGSRMNDNSKSKVCFDCGGVHIVVQQKKLMSFVIY